MDAMRKNEFAPPPEVWAHWLNELIEENPDAGTEYICQVMVDKASQYGADIEFRECCAALGRNLPVWPDWSTADIIRMLKDERRPWSKGYDFSLQT